jgi:hypothetical protein
MCRLAKLLASPYWPEHRIGETLIARSRHVTSRD